MTYEYYYPPMGYDEIVATQGEVIGQWVMGTWQGDYIYLLKNKDKYSFFVIGYGSCSGCDALESCENDEEFNELKQDIINRIAWGTKQEIVDHINNEEANRWYFHEDGWEEIQKEALDLLNGN